MSQIPDSFMKAVNKLKLNDSIEDSRLKVVFHTCRHSFASWLVADGTDLFTVCELMGHKSIAMTARYSHLSPDTLRKAFNSLESARSQSFLLGCVTTKSDVTLEWLQKSLHDKLRYSVSLSSISRAIKRISKNQVHLPIGRRKSILKKEVVVNPLGGFEIIVALACMHVILGGHKG